MDFVKSMDVDKSIPAGYALETVTSRFAGGKKLDEGWARAEAKEALTGALANDRLRSCPVGCLTSSFEAGFGRPADYRYEKYDHNGNVELIAMAVQGSEYVYIPHEFWLDFLNPAAATSSNWVDGHFSFRLEKDGETALGEVLHLVFDKKAVETIGRGAFQASSSVNSGKPGRRALAKELYCRELRRRIEQEEIRESLAEEAKYLHGWLRAHHRVQKMPGLGTIKNNIRVMFKDANIATK